MPNDGLHWTKGKPTTPGYYWLAEEGTPHKYMVYVCDNGTAFFQHSVDVIPEDCSHGGHWAGPLEPPATDGKER
jgi:hypothetical protein